MKNTWKLRLSWNRQSMQHNHDNGSRLSLVGYVIWKLDNKSTAWVSSDTEIYSNSFSVSLYPSVIYKSTYPEITSPWWNHLQTIQAHLSCNTSHGGAATLQIFRLPRWRYSYSTWSSMMELLLSVSQHWNLCLGQ